MSRHGQKQTNKQTSDKKEKRCRNVKKKASRSLQRKQILTGLAKDYTVNK